MSLTSLIHDTHSPVRRWFAAEFPDMAAAMRELRATMPDLAGRTIRPTGAGTSTVGMAVDYRLRLLLAPVVVEELVAWEGAAMVALDLLPARSRARASRVAEPLRWEGAAHLAPAAFFGAFEAYVEAHPPRHERLKGPIELRLARYCYLLGLYEEVFRLGGIQPTSALATVPRDASAAEVLAIAPDERVRDIASIARRCYPVLEPYFDRPLVVNPTFEGSLAVGGADGDIVLDRCLVDRFQAAAGSATRKGSLKSAPNGALVRGTGRR